MKIDCGWIVTINGLCTRAGGSWHWRAYPKYTPTEITIKLECKGNFKTRNGCLKNWYKFAEKYGISDWEEDEMNEINLKVFNDIKRDFKSGKLGWAKAK